MEVRFMDPMFIAFAVIFLAFILLLVMFFNFIPVGLWISAISAGVKVSLFSLVGMRLRRVKPVRVINPLIKGTKAGLDVSQGQLESHLLSGYADGGDNPVRQISLVPGAEEEARAFLAYSPDTME